MSSSLWLSADPSFAPASRPETSGGGQGVHQYALNLPAPCYWYCCVRLLLLDGPVLLVLLVLLWPSQAVRGPDVAGVDVSASSCLTVRYYCYCWCCSSRLKLSTTRNYWYCWCSSGPLKLSTTRYYCNGASPSRKATTTTGTGGTSVHYFLTRKNIATL